MEKTKEDIRIVPHDSDHYWQAVNLRYALLRVPLGLKFTDEELANEDKELHFVYVEGDKVKACLVLRPLSNERIKMRQVAVLPDLQHQGIGKKLVAFSESYAQKRGYKVMECHARLEAVGFYERLGYEKQGNKFYEVSIPHYKMEKVLFNK